MDSSSGRERGDTSGPRRSSERSGKIPISILIEPTDAVSELARSQQAMNVAAFRKTSSSETSSSSPSLSDAPRSSAPVPFLTKPVPNTNTLPPIQDITLSGRSDSESSRSTSAFERPEPSWSSSDLSRKPRPPRPSYSEEQKFFIMYARIMRDHSWPEIEDQFAEIFGQRSKGGLTSVYYRVRKDWGLMEVLKSGPGSFAADCKEVEKRALNFSTEFLGQIEYLEP